MAGTDTYIRQLSVDDVEKCLVVETAAFPPTEAATRGKIEYRLSVAPELARGLFVREAEGDRLIAHTISTMSVSPTVQDEDMAYPEDWKTSSATQSVGHKPQGRTITLHSLAVDPAHQKSGFGRRLMKAYIEEMQRSGKADRIAILTYDRLVPYYEKLGFTHYGKSKSEYAGVAWHDLPWHLEASNCLRSMDRIGQYLEPPFSKDVTLRHRTKLVLPHSIRHNDHLLRTRDDIQLFLKRELLTPKLDAIHRWIWLAGLPKPARPLHRQNLLQRTVQVTENPDEHLVWHEGCIFVKPLPEYLFDHEFWTSELIFDSTLHKSACGLLLSYAWLIAHKSDFRVARDLSLLPVEVDYDYWSDFIASVLGHIDQATLQQVGSRYHYGELRLSRLNSLYRIGAAGISTHNLVYGFMASSARYNTFFARNFGWIFIIFVYMSIVLSALQVALGIDRLGDNLQFHHFAYGISMLSMGFVATAVVLVFLVWWLLFWFHLLSTAQYNKEIVSRRRATG
ncbi:N-acetyltransferase [Paramyrothecium foliicola]|nr:N-acetyltransferase [Paramyrothecium foliicola]